MGLAPGVGRAKPIAAAIKRAMAKKALLAMVVSLVCVVKRQSLTPTAHRWPRGRRVQVARRAALMT